AHCHILCFASCSSATAPTEPVTLSLHDALPILACELRRTAQEIKPKDLRLIVSQQTFSHPEVSPCLPKSTTPHPRPQLGLAGRRSEEHTSELQSRFDLVCRLLLEKKNKQQIKLK